MSDQKRSEKEESPQSLPPPKDSAPEEEKSSGKGMNYVFKIAPADPKNSFDFEDVADK